MIFVVGTGRSGTNMLRDLLNLHPQVYIPQETHWLPKMHEFFGGGRYPCEDFVDIVERTFYHDGMSMIDYILEDFEMTKPELWERVAAVLPDRAHTTVEEVNRAIYEELARAKGKHVWGDKTPEYGFYMGLIRELWPEARFVHVVRDGRDVALSMSRHEGFQRMVELGIINWVPVSFDHYYRSGERNGVDAEAVLRTVWDRLPAPVRGAVKRALASRPRQEPAEPPPLDDYIRLWERRLRRIADEAKRVDTDRYLEIRYEDVLAEPRSMLERIVAFLSLNEDARWLDDAEATLRRDNTRKVRDAAQHEHLTALARETLEAWGYA